MKLFIATAENALGSYDIDGVGQTAADAVRTCKMAVRQARHKAGLDPYPYMDDIQALGPFVPGKAYLDMGRAGEAV